MFSKARLVPALALSALSAGTALAQQTPRDAGPQPVDPRVCRVLERHVPSADVAHRPGAEQGGAERGGRRVVPADLPGSHGTPGPQIVPVDIQIGVDLAKRLGVPQDKLNQRMNIPPGQGLFVGDAVAATITLVGDEVLINGNPLTPASERELYLLCRQRR